MINIRVYLKYFLTFIAGFLCFVLVRELKPSIIGYLSILIFLIGVVCGNIIAKENIKCQKRKKIKKKK